MKSVA